MVDQKLIVIRRRHRCLLLITLLCCFVGYIQNTKALNTFISLADVISETSSKASSSMALSSCKYRSYPWTEAGTRLPFLGDVFASADGKYVNFVGTHRRQWGKEYEESDWAFGRHFLCVFGNEHRVLSEKVHPAYHEMFIIHCKIPPPFQHLVEFGQVDTLLHVDLHALDDLDLQQVHNGSLNVSFPKDRPKLAKLPICHPVPLQGCSLIKVSWNKNASGIFTSLVPK